MNCHPKGNQFWIVIGGTDAEAPIPWVTWCEEPIHWKRPWCWERLKAGGEGDENVGWYHWLNGHEFEQAPRVGDGQGSLVCCSPWSHKESDTTEWLNWNDASELCICLEIFLSSRFMSIVLWPEIMIVLWQENDLSFYLKMQVVEEGPGTTLSLLRHFFYLISNLDQIDYILCSQRWRSSIQ